MGLFDFIKDAGSKIFGKDHDRGAEGATKPLSTHLREHGIDPTGNSFRFQRDNVVMEGTVRDQHTR